MYDVVVIGGGPAGVAAGVYVGRKQMKALLLTDTFGGQSFNSGDIENWIGTPHISGFDLAQQLEAHVREQETVEIKTYEPVTNVEQTTHEDFVKPVWRVSTKKSTYQSKSVIIASGGRRRRLEVPGEDAFEGRGVAYCSTCDAPLFRGKKVVVVGSGNAAMEGVVDLLPFATDIYLMIRGEHMKGDEATAAKIEEHVGEKVTIMYQAAVKEIHGEQLVNAVTYTDLASNETAHLETDGVFVEIGSLPNSEFAKEVVDINTRGQIEIDHRRGTTSADGIFAAGAVVDQAYDQNNISVGDAIKAALSCHTYVTHFK